MAGIVSSILKTDNSLHPLVVESLLLIDPCWGPLHLLKSDLFFIVFHICLFLF
jgi:hypothetical protein